MNQASRGTMDPARLLKVVLRGIAQVMFQPHAGTGLFFVLGLVIGSPLGAFGAVLGSAIGASVALALKFPREEVDQGIFGFNSSLVGLALLVFLRPTPVTWVLLVVGSVLAAVLTRGMRRYVPFPTYTAPFILVTWACLLLAHGVEGKGIDHSASPAPAPSGIISSVLAGEAEVMLGASALAGVLFLVGIALSDPRHAALALIGSIVGTFLAFEHRDTAGAVSLGLYGYNPALTAIAVYLWRPSLLGPILGAAIAWLLSENFPASLGLPQLTAPFVVAAWIVLVLGWLESAFLGRWPGIGASNA